MTGLLRKLKNLKNVIPVSRKVHEKKIEALLIEHYHAIKQTRTSAMRDASKRCATVQCEIDDLVHNLSNVTVKQGDYSGRGDIFCIRTDVSLHELRQAAGGKFEYADYIGESVGRQVAAALKYHF